MALDTSLPPPATQQQSAWEQFLNQAPTMTQDLLQFRYGYLSRTPLESSRNLINTQYQRTPVPHPQSKHYPMIETAKRNKAQAIQRARQVQAQARFQQVPVQRPRWLLPQENPDLLAFRPDIRRFTQPSVRFRLPKW